MLSYTSEDGQHRRWAEHCSPLSTIPLHTEQAVAFRKSALPTSGASWQCHYYVHRGSRFIFGLRFVPTSS